MSNLPYLCKKIKRDVSTRLLVHMSECNLRESNQFACNPNHSVEVVLDCVLNNISTASKTGSKHPSLHRRCQVAAYNCAILNAHLAMLTRSEADAPQRYLVRRASRTSLSMPKHAFTELISRIYSTGRTFIRSAVQTWTGRPDSVVVRSMTKVLSPSTALCIIVLFLQ